MTVIFDGDYPLAYGAFELNRDPTLPLAELRAQDESGVMNREAFACFPEMRRGGVAVALMKITVRQLREGSILPGTRGEPLTYATARGYLAYYHALAGAGEAVVITTRSQLQEHIARWQTAAGNAKHAATGGDTDGQGGTEGAPLEIDSVADYQKIEPILSARGYSADDVADIMYRNWQRVYAEHLPAEEGVPTHVDSPQSVEPFLPA